MTVTKLITAAQLRHYGASELMLATMTGCYPPPHDEMDATMAQIEQDAAQAEFDEEVEAYA